MIGPLEVKTYYVFQLALKKSTSGDVMFLVIGRILDDSLTLVHT